MADNNPETVQLLMSISADIAGVKEAIEGLETRFSAVEKILARHEEQIRALELSQRDLKDVPDRVETLWNRMLIAMGAILLIGFIPSLAVFLSLIGAK